MKLIITNCPDCGKKMRQTSRVIDGKVITRRMICSCGCYIDILEPGDAE